MKKAILVTLVTGAVAASSMAQGIINLSAGSGKIKYTTDKTTFTSIPSGHPDNVPGYGQVNLAFYSAAPGTTISLLPDGLPDLSAWYQSSTIATSFGPLAGAMGTTSFTLSSQTGAAGATEQLEVVAWTGTATSFTAAEAAATGLLGFAGSSLSTGALGWQEVTGTSSSPAASTTGTGGFNGLVLAPVPEPGTIALGGLGAAALLLFRRRK